MDRAERFDGTLRNLMRADTRGEPAGEDPFELGLHSLRLTWGGEFETGAQVAAEALTRAADPDSLALARAVAGLSIASWTEGVGALRDPHTGGDPLLAALDEASTGDPRLEPAIDTLLAEAALACARVDLSAQFLDRHSSPAVELFGDPRHGFLTFARALSARVHAFRGDVASALTFADAAVEGASGSTELVFAEACAALVRGNADQRRETRRLVDLVASGEIVPTDALTRGCFVLAAYGAVALGDLDRSASLVLRGGGGPDLSSLRIIDRVLGLELLTAAAVDAGDLDAAESWLDRGLALAGHPIADSTVSRMRSRVALLAGDPNAAVEHASAAVARAEADGRMIEASEGGILLARAHIARGDRGTAARDLAESARRARELGHLSVLRAASRELRTVGRRLPPEPLSGWEGLSARERDVALLLAEGRSNAEVATELFLSEHTVRMHVSRVLYAFAVPTRSGVAAALADRSPVREGIPPLTPRQRQVVDHLVAGHSNSQIANDLAVGVSTVEKHISAILHRWQVGSRAGIVRLALAHHDRGQSPG
jgi:DNA-binding NarL/FixJ family response regulator